MGYIELIQLCCTLGNIEENIRLKRFDRATTGNLARVIGLMQGKRDHRKYYINYKAQGRPYSWCKGSLRPFLIIYVER